jgi:phosphoribosylformylglycinamidine synthase
MKARIEVMLRDGVLDPQAEAVGHALASLGFSGITGVRQGKLIELELDRTDPVAAEAEVREMCDRLLANAVIERYSIQII